MTLLRKNKQFQRGSLPILIAIVVMGFILITTIVTAAAMVGDRTGVGSGGSVFNDSTDTEDSTPPTTGSGACTASNVLSDPIRNPAYNAVPVTVPIWKYVSQTQKISSHMTLRVNRNCTTTIRAIFQQIYNSPDQPPIKTADTGCYAARPNNTSVHNWGGACDINWTENYCVYRSGGLCGPAGFWKPDSNVLSMPINGTIQNAFSDAGWGRGLWSKKLDYMHYSVNGK